MGKNMNAESTPIVLIGAGKVATQLGIAFKNADFPISQVYNRSTQKGQALAKLLGAESTDQLERVKKGAGLYLIAVKDDAISEIAELLSKTIPASSLVGHVSGATPSTVLRPHFVQSGVFYPLQTFSIDKNLDFKKIPICIYSANRRSQQQLAQIAATISNKVYQVNDDQRGVLHLAAVFANNFTNHLFLQAQEILQGAGLPFEILLPLLEETVEKLKTINPKDAQTGPAARNDQITITQHLQLLHNQPTLQLIYQTLTDSIKATHNNPKSSIYLNDNC